MNIFKTKFKITVTHDMLCGLSNWIEDWLDKNEAAEDGATRLAYIVLLKMINIGRIDENIRFRFSGKKNITLKPEEIFALAYAIEITPSVNETDYLGSFLLATYGRIHQHFQTLNF